MEMRMTAKEKSVQQLYRDYAPRLRQFASRRLGWEESEDVVQEAYLRLVKEGAEKLTCPRAYLYRITANLVIDMHRRRKLRSAFTDAATPFDESVVLPIHSDTPNVAELHHYSSTFEQLSPLRKQIILLKVVDGATNTEIADRCGVSTRTVERHLTKARGDLRHSMVFQSSNPA
jgi:RNA polymerase sigma factor (sigma-70 family)